MRHPIPGDPTRATSVPGLRAPAPARTDPAGVDLAGALASVPGLCSDLIRIDSANPTSDERVIAEHVATLLADVGLHPTVVESQPRRASVLCRWPGDPQGTAERGALVIYGHLDVVAADPAEWQVHPFSGEITDAHGDTPPMVWGRGAVDMKGMDAMVLATVRAWAAAGRRPPRDVVLAFFADEEAGGVLGAHHVADHHREWFDGATEAIGEVGGFSTTIARNGDAADPVRLYLLETAQKGIAWLRLQAKGRAGHGSMANDANAVLRLAEAVTRLGTHPWPVRLVPSVERLLREVCEVAGIPFDPNDPQPAIDRLGGVARMVATTVRHSTTPTGFSAGGKVNVIPSHAEALIDGRFLPGHEEEFFTTVDELLGPHVRREFVHHDIAVEAPFDGRLVDVMTSSLLAEDPQARVVPYCLSGGTDAKSLDPLGIRCYGFAPLRLPPGLDFAGMFHGIDERVPVDALQFGVRVLDRFLRAC